MLRELCAKLVDAFVVNQGDLARLKCAIDYMVQYGYKRSENDKKQLRDLLEAVLIDGISIQSALEESPGFKRVVVTVRVSSPLLLKLFSRNTQIAATKFITTCLHCPANRTLRTTRRSRRRWRRLPKRFSREYVQEL